MISKWAGRWMEQRGNWTDQRMDRWAYLIPVVALTRKIQKSTVTGVGGVPEQNVSGASVQNSRNPFWDFPGGPDVKTLTSNVGGGGPMPAWGANMLHAM